MLTMPISPVCIPRSDLLHRPSSPKVHRLRARWSGQPSSTCWMEGCSWRKKGNGKSVSRITYDYVHKGWTFSFRCRFLLYWNSDWQGGMWVKMRELQSTDIWHRIIFRLQQFFWKSKWEYQRVVPETKCRSKGVFDCATTNETVP